MEKIFKVQNKNRALITSTDINLKDITDKNDLIPQQNPIPLLNNYFGVNKNDSIEIKKIKSFDEEKEKKEIENDQNVAKFILVKTSILKFLDHNLFILIMTLFTFYSLIATDMRDAFLPMNFDFTISLLLTITLGIFSVEFFCLVIFSDEYIFSFNFYIDIVAIFTLFFDNQWIFNFQGDAAASFQIKTARNLKTVQIARIVKIIRVIRIIRVIKLYKIALKKMYQKRKDNLNKKEETKELNFELKNKLVKIFGKRKEKDESKDSILKNSLFKKKKFNESKVQIVEIPEEKPCQKLDNLTERKVDHESSDAIESTNKTKSQIKSRFKNYFNFDKGKVIDQIPDLFNFENKSKVITHDEKEIKDEESRKNKTSKTLDLNFKKDIKGEFILQTPASFFGNQPKSSKTFENISVKHEPHSLNKSRESLIESEIKKKSIKKEKINEFERAKKESNLSRKFSSGIVRILIYLILSILVIFPLFDEDWLNSNTISYIHLSKLIEGYYIGSLPLSFENFNSTPFQMSFKSRIEFHSDPKFPLMSVILLDTNEQYFKNYEISTLNLRNSEYVYLNSDKNYFQLTYSVKYLSVVLGILGLSRSLVLSFYIIISTILFEKDAKSLVVDHLELLIEIVERVSNNPIKAKDEAYLQEGVKSIVSQIQSESHNKKRKEIFEIKVIKSTIIKISSLLATCYGLAGEQIIKEKINMNSNDIPYAKKIFAIFGFCDIREFSKINIALQEKSLVFVNEIAEIVHSCVDQFGGETNKNIGEAFLCVWKIDPLDYEIDNKNNISYKNIDRIRLLADQAFLAFISIISKINRNHNLLTYTQTKEILSKLPDYRLRMSFGIHVGWGIEGAIGSNYKIDATYLSPYVNISARLMAATKQLGENFLFSGELFELMSIGLKSYCRLVDIVKVKGSITPVKLYSPKLNLDLTSFSKVNEIDCKVNQKVKKLKSKLKRERIVDYMKENKNSMMNYVLQKKSLREIFNHKKNEMFYPTYDEAVLAYLKGNWKYADELIQKCLWLDRNDGPSRTLSKFLKSFNFVCPLNWTGSRELTSK